MKTWLAFLFLIAGLWQPALANQLTVGMAWPTLQLADQHDQAGRLDDGGLRTIVFAAERKPGDWAQEVVEKCCKDLASSGRLALILDISRMPSLITSMFALPSFRARTFPIHLAYTAEAAGMLPRRESAVTVMTLDGGKIAAVTYASDANALEKILARLPATPLNQDKR